MPFPENTHTLKEQRVMEHLHCLCTEVLLNLLPCTKLKLATNPPRENAFKVTLPLTPLIQSPLPRGSPSSSRSWRLFSWFTHSTLPSETLNDTVPVPLGMPHRKEPEQSPARSVWPLLQFIPKHLMVREQEQNLLQIFPIKFNTILRGTITNST